MHATTVNNKQPFDASRVAKPRKRFLTISFIIETIITIIQDAMHVAILPKTRTGREIFFPKSSDRVII